MKAISLWQPWASAMAVGLKRIETRHWDTNYRGRLAIHAAKKPFSPRHVSSKLVMFLWDHRARFGTFNKIQELFDSLPMGKIVCIVNLDRTQPTEIASLNLTEEEAIMGNYEPGRFAWKTSNYRKLDNPIPCVGHQGFFFTPENVHEMINNQLSAVKG